MSPPARMTSPDPVPLPPWPLAAIVTTEGMTRSATEVTGQALTVVAPAEAAGDCELAAELDDCVAPTMRPPATPPTTSAAPTATHSNHRRGPRERVVVGSVTSAPHSGRWQPQRRLGMDNSQDAIVA